MITITRTTLALAAAFVLFSFAAARAEDPELGTVHAFHPAVEQAQGSKHPLPFSDLDRRRLNYQKS